MCVVLINVKYKVKIQNYSYFCNPLVIPPKVMQKKREPEDEQLCIAVHTINAVNIAPRQPILEQEILKLLPPYCLT